ncbi:MAG TPA: SHOCT domain-containing protein [Solirubrobacterales bacterium]|nr:SHOCT domain-containing protein [Solirubrobacterales bacterium]
MSRRRRRTIKALVVLGSVFAFLSVFAIWTERQALNTDDWVRTSDRLIENSTIRAAVGDYLVDQLYANVDVEKEIKEILPGDTKELAGPVSGGLRQVAGDGANQVLQTTTAQDLWQDANRTAHEQLLAVLEDDKEAVSTEEGEVTLQLGSLVTNLAQEVGIGEQLAEKLPPDAGQVTILRSEDLRTAQDIVIAVKGLAIVLTLLTFLCFGLAIYLSRDARWVTVLFCGAGLIAAGFAVIVARQVAGGIVVGQLVDDQGIEPAAEAAWSIATSLMVSIATTVIVIGALFVLAGWLASPTAPARSARRTMTPVLRDYPAYVYSGLAILVGLYFLSAPIQNLRSFLTTLVVAGLAAFGIRELRRQGCEENPGLSLDDVFGRTRDRMVGAVKNANIGERVGETASKLRLPEVRMPSGDRAGAGEGASDPEEVRLSRLERLGDLHAKGVLTDEELAAEKARLLERT